jgi:hypothetical protein
MSNKLRTVEFPLPDSEDFVTLFISISIEWDTDSHGLQISSAVVEYIDCPELDGKNWSEHQFVSEFGQANFDWAVSMSSEVKKTDLVEYEKECVQLLDGAAVNDDEPQTSEGDPHSAEKFAKQYPEIYETF